VELYIARRDDTEELGAELAILYVLVSWLSFASTKLEDVIDKAGSEG